MILDAMSMVVIAACLAAGALGGLFFAGNKRGLTLSEYERKAEEKMKKAEKEAGEIVKETREKAQDLQETSQENEKRIQEQNKRIESIITLKEQQKEKKEEKMKEITQALENEEKAENELQKALEKSKEELKVRLAAKVGTTMEEAREELLESLKRDLELMKEERVRKMEEYLGEEKVRIAKNMVAGAIQRYSAPTSVEKRSLAITVQRDEHKARLIGPNGQTLLLLEELTGCDIIFNDAPGLIIISCFDLVKKHIGRELVMKLLKEKPLNEEQIRQKLEEVKATIEKNLIRIGKETVTQLELGDRKFNNDFYRIVGRLQFRTSYGQNILKHSFEVGYFTLMLGAELGLNMETCKIGGFFHDLGKAIDHEVGEPHDILSKRIMEEHQCFSPEEIHAAWAHHDAVPQETAEAMLVKAGDAISAGRPGARQETLEKYIERIKAIEGIANSYEGVAKTYAISAGRELRVIVEPAVLEDDDLGDLATEIAGEIEENVAYPGQIKVNVIRRTQSLDIAKPK